jgi:hypothetical protein
VAVWTGASLILYGETPCRPQIVAFRQGSQMRKGSTIPDVDAALLTSDKNGP